MATHDLTIRVRNLGRTRMLIAGVVVTLGITTFGAVPAHAVPRTDPSTSGGARAAWQQSTHQAEVAAEQVNGARQTQLKAEQAASHAASDLAVAKTKVTSTQLIAATAAAHVASYQTKLDAFASASFRGARLSQLSVMLTATSAADFLDESTVMNRVAADTQLTLSAAIAARNSASAAKTAAGTAELESVQAKNQADRAATAATAATATATDKKHDLDAAVAKYKNLFNKLSAKEKAAAAAAAEKIRQESLAAAAAAAAQAQAAADAAVQKAADKAASSSAAASSKAASSLSSVQAANSAPPVNSPPVESVPPANSVPPAAALKAGADSQPATTATPSVTAAPPSSGGDSAGAIAAAAARTKIGFAYTYAGDGPSSFDCSGLTTWAWAQAGVSIPRVSFEQSNFPEVPLDQLQPGDLVTYYSPVSHVAIYVGGGMVVSAADEALGVIYVPVERGGPNATGHRVPRG
ncbi:MAG: NlpC/P60 family protein [Actinomycetota bacterium]|nr:NlpC/P60 family protein [Actinomycetota bacterium]